MKSYNQQQIDSGDNIVILGAGLSGMITALSLAAMGKKLVIIESRSVEDERFFADPRSTAITDSSKIHFEEIGIWNDVLEISGPIKDIYVVDNKSPEMIHFDSNDIDKESKPYMGYLVLNNEFKKLLLGIVKNNKNITLMDQTVYQQITNTDNGCSIKLLDNRQIDCDMIIVCDGRESRAKSLFFSDSLQKDYQQKAMTFVVEHEKNHEGTAVEHFLPSGPFAILPLKDPHKSSIVWTLDNERAQAVESLSADEFLYMVQENFGEFLGKIKINEQPKLFPLSARLASRYVNKRVVLLADTAHIIHPLAGQGLNQGIKDISELAKVITHEGVSAAALQNYEKARKIDNHNMLEITDTINAVFSSNSKLLRMGRKAAFETIEKVTPFKRALMKYAMGRRK